MYFRLITYIQLHHPHVCVTLKMNGTKHKDNDSGKLLHYSLKIIYSPDNIITTKCCNKVLTFSGWFLHYLVLLHYWLLQTPFNTINQKCNFASRETVVVSECDKGMYLFAYFLCKLSIILHSNWEIIAS